MFQFKQRKRSTFAATALTALMSVATIGFAADETTAMENHGFDIAAQSDRSDRGFQNSSVKVTMLLRNATGKETSRELILTTLEVQDEMAGDKTLVAFTSPKDIDGTSLLSHAHILTPDDQWLYLPSIKRIKRISTANKSGPFVGSEFAFEDMTGQELNKYSYTYLGDKPCGDLVCDLVERTPLYEGSAYSRQIAWIDRRDRQIRRIEYFDRKNDCLKTLEYADYKKYPGGYWRAHLMTMRNHQTGKETELSFENYQFGLSLSDNDFAKGALSHLH